MAIEVVTGDDYAFWHILLLHFGLREIEGKCKFADIPNADSLDILEIALALEDEFDIDLVDTPVTLESTPLDLLHVVKRLRGAA